MERFNSKVLLFGEYSAQSDSMALVLPWSRYYGHLDFCTNDTRSEFAIESNNYLRNFSNFLARHPVENFVLDVKQLEHDIEDGLFFQSNIPQGYGLGSSGALVAAIVLQYLKDAEALRKNMKEMTVEKLSELQTGLGKLESFFHGSSSGLDPLSIILNKPILYESHKEIWMPQLPAPDEAGKNVVFLLNTRISRTTSRLVNMFRELYHTSEFKNKVREELVLFTNNSIHNFLDNQPSRLYQNLDKLVRFQLNEMNDFIPSPFGQLAKKGIEHGDYFLKLCGAGGGGFMLGFTEAWDAANELLKDYQTEIVYRY